MTKLQRIYREMRKYMSKADARYAAPRLLQAYREAYEPPFNSDEYVCAQYGL